MIFEFHVILVESNASFLLSVLVRNLRGAFKFRGASNAILSLEEQEAVKGVVTHSR